MNLAKRRKHIGNQKSSHVFLKDFSKHLLSLDDLKPEQFLRFFNVFSEKVFDNVTK